MGWPEGEGSGKPGRQGVPTTLPSARAAEPEGGGPAAGGLHPLFSRHPFGASLSMADATEDPTVFTAHSLPSDPRLWATVTNAYLGTRVYHNVLHVSGVYNGAGRDTHRAILPSPLNVQLEAPAGTGEPLTKTFGLDTNTGSHFLSCPHNPHLEFRMPDTQRGPGTPGLAAQVPRQDSRARGGGGAQLTEGADGRGALSGALSGRRARRLLSAHHGGLRLPGLPAHLRPPHAASRPGLQRVPHPPGRREPAHHGAAEVGLLPREPGLGPAAGARLPRSQVSRAGPAGWRGKGLAPETGRAPAGTCTATLSPPSSPGGHSSRCTCCGRRCPQP